MKKFTINAFIDEIDERLEKEYILFNDDLCNEHMFEAIIYDNEDNELTTIEIFYSEEQEQTRKLPKFYFGDMELELSQIIDLTVQIQNFLVEHELY